MNGYETRPNKTGRNDSKEHRKPATVVMRDGTVIDAIHRFVDSEGRLCVYLDDPSTGIDARINLDEIVVELESDEAHEVIGNEREVMSA